MNLKERIVEDYFKKSRLPEYKKTLQIAKDQGYQMVGVLDFARLVKTGGLKGKKIYINRHDIDTSPKVAAEMFAIERGIFGETGSASYYFRETTIDIQLIHELDAYGYETGYHYEELATYAKKYKLRSREEILVEINKVGKVFLSDLERFRKTTGSKSLSIASHGDFINTKFDIQSYEIVRIPEIREKAMIEVEAYDEDINCFIQERYADQNLLSSFADVVVDAFEREIPVVMTLTHPRNWKVDVWSNTKENISRLIQGIEYCI